MYLEISKGMVSFPFMELQASDARLSASTPQIRPHMLGRFPGPPSGSGPDEIGTSLPCGPGLADLTLDQCALHYRTCGACPKA